MTDIKAAIFDMDGLLIDSERVALMLFLQTCERYDLNNKSELQQVFYLCIGANAYENDRILKQALGHQVDIKTFLQECEADYQQYMEHNTIPVKHGVEDLLDALHRRDIPTAIATSSRTKHAISKLDKCNLTHRFKSIIGGDQVEKSKPEPDIFLQAAASIDVAPEHCLAFEDSVNGVRAAVAAGMQVVQVPDLIEPDAELLALGHRVVTSLADVEALIWSER